MNRRIATGLLSLSLALACTPKDSASSSATGAGGATTGATAAASSSSGAGGMAGTHPVCMELVQLDQSVSPQVGCTPVPMLQAACEASLLANGCESELQAVVTCSLPLPVEDWSCDADNTLTLAIGCDSESTALTACQNGSSDATTTAASSGGDAAASSAATGSVESTSNTSASTGGGGSGCLPSCLARLKEMCPPLSGACTVESQAQVEDRYCYADGSKMRVPLSGSTSSFVGCPNLVYTTTFSGAITFQDATGADVATVSSNGGTSFTVTCGGVDYAVDSSSAACINDPDVPGVLINADTTACTPGTCAISL